MMKFYDYASQRDRFIDNMPISPCVSLLPFQVRAAASIVNVYVVDMLGNRNALVIAIDSQLTTDGDYAHTYLGGDLSTPFTIGFHGLEIEAGLVTLYSEWFRCIDFSITTNTRDARRLPLPIVFSEEDVDESVYVYFETGYLPAFQHLEKIVHVSLTAYLETEAGDVDITAHTIVTLEGDYVRYWMNKTALLDVIPNATYRIRLEDNTVVLRSNLWGV